MWIFLANNVTYESDKGPASITRRFIYSRSKIEPVISLFVPQYWDLFLVSANSASRGLSLRQQMVSVIDELHQGP